MSHRTDQSSQGQGKIPPKKDTSTDVQKDCHETLGLAADSGTGSLPQKTQKAQIQPYDGPAWTKEQMFFWNSQYTFRAHYGYWPDRFHCEFFQMFERWPDYSEMEHYNFHGTWPCLPWWWNNVFGNLSEAWELSRDASGPLPEASLQWHDTSGPRYLSWKRWQDASRAMSEAPKPWHDASGPRSEAPNPFEAAESTVTQDAESQEQTTWWNRPRPTWWDESNARILWW